MTGISSIKLFEDIQDKTSKPSITGITISRSIKAISLFFLSNISNACLPSVASIIS